MVDMFKKNRGLFIFGLSVSVFALFGATVAILMVNGLPWGMALPGAGIAFASFAGPIFLIFSLLKWVEYYIE